jgi:hypothetical protein
MSITHFDVAAFLLDFAAAVVGDTVGDPFSKFRVAFFLI